jgi:hypothetical protein
MMWRYSNVAPHTQCVGASAGGHAVAGASSPNKEHLMRTWSPLQTFRFSASFICHAPRVDDSIEHNLKSLPVDHDHAPRR